MCQTRNKQDCIPVGCVPPACCPYLPTCTELWGACVWSQGGAALGGACLWSRGCLLLGGGVPASGPEGGLLQGGMYPSMQWGRMTCKNITLSQTSFAGGNNFYKRIFRKNYNERIYCSITTGVCSTESKCSPVCLYLPMFVR